MDIYVYDKWISVWIDSGYEWIYMVKKDNYMDMQVVSTWIYSGCLDIPAYQRWRSHLNIHGYAKWNMDINGYLDGKQHG